MLLRPFPSKSTVPFLVSFRKYIVVLRIKAQGIIPVRTGISRANSGDLSQNLEVICYQLVWTDPYKWTSTWHQLAYPSALIEDWNSTIFLTCLDSIEMKPAAYGLLDLPQLRKCSEGRPRNMSKSNITTGPRDGYNHKDKNCNGRTPMQRPWRRLCIHLGFFSK